MEVEQGPRWLAELIYGPPTWLLFVVVLLFLGGCVGLVYAGKQASLDEGAVAEMATNVSVLVVAAGATTVVKPLGFSYAVDVGLGAGVGVLAGYAVVGPVVRWGVSRSEFAHAFLSSDS
jgi:Na+/glutamate symporter